MGKTWSKYVRLVTALVNEVGGSPLVVTPEAPDPREGELLRNFCTRLGKRRNDPQATALLEQLEIRPSYVRQHLRFVADMSALKRRQLAGGAALRVLEEDKDNMDEALAALKGEQLRGSVSNQRRQIRGAAHQQAGVEPPQPDQRGWLQPRPTREKVEMRLSPIWLYNGLQINDPTALDPMVARALLHACLPKKGGRVIDPMAGSGVIGLEAIRLGHQAWLSDLNPGDRKWIRKHNLLLGEAKPNALDRLTGEGIADLLVLHPPLRSQLDRDAEKLEEFVKEILDRTTSTVKSGGKVALIVSVLEAPDALQDMARLLTDNVGHTKAENTANRRPSRGLEGHHLAVSTDGKQGWHILIAKMD